MAPAGEVWGAPRDLAAPQNVEFNYSQTVAIRDAQHAGAVWATSDGGGAGTVASFAECSPTATPATPARASIRGLGTAFTTIPAYSVATLQVDAGSPSSGCHRPYWSSGWAPDGWPSGGCGWADCSRETSGSA